MPKHAQLLKIRCLIMVCEWQSLLEHNYFKKFVFLNRQSHIYVASQQQIFFVKKCFKMCNAQKKEGQQRNKKFIILIVIARIYDE